MVHTPRALRAGRGARAVDRAHHRASTVCLPQPHLPTVAEVTRRSSGGMVRCTADHFAALSNRAGVVDMGVIELSCALYRAIDLSRCRSPNSVTSYSVQGKDTTNADVCSVYCLYRRAPLYVAAERSVDTIAAKQTARYGH
jgi:hypothetical protein